MVDELLRDFVRFMDGHSLVLFLLILVPLQPVIALAHELGHAFAAVARLPGPVVVGIGEPRPLVSFRIGRITVYLHPLMLPWRFDAVCLYEEHDQSRTDAVLIALTGPAASVVTGLATWAALRATAGTPWVDAVLGVATVASFATALVCLVPLTLTDSRGDTLRTDGACVLAAMR